MRHLTLITLGLLTLCLARAATGAASDDRPVEDASKAGLVKKERAELPTLWVIGDSTVRVGTNGQRGWGDELRPFFDTAKINIVNRAIGGRSSRTFLTDGRWDAILKELRPGDVVIMQFGHNDAGPINEKPPRDSKTRARGTIRGNGDETVFVEKNIITGKPETVHSYGWYIRNYVATAKSKGAIPVVCSPVPRKSWDSESASAKINRASGSYGLWARQAAEQSGALFVDLNEIIARGYEKLGRAAIEPFFADKGTHTTREGAAFNARAVVSGLNSFKDDNPLAAYLSEDGGKVPAFVP
ncbi:rhamnogalacturonan acetylesterase [Ereboglobus sp. PH5-10]|uniref:rhamnogalacturonan acetylesterase n=1 Tax=Ereboglobus sp. PH5-10 TaxID=2940629 RepID=UPI002406A582|nr:rhamnogalacturonan acetylesterase [Ereboglobus sp. PH5-10]MDF9827596.1 rhamnogalacturonan acetylesterase [Ereboglobus sp. PH5-10]